MRFFCNIDNCQGKFIESQSHIDTEQAIILKDTYENAFTRSNDELSNLKKTLHSYQKII